MMTDLCKQMLATQFAASLCTLSHAVERCPDEIWNAPVARYPFCQVAFHTLFFADLYLELNEEGLSRQPFHRANPEFFGDYEQLQYREPQSLYERSQIRTYLEFVRDKANATIAAETAETLSAPEQFQRRLSSRAELYLYNLRHIQHHTAQLILRLRLDSDVDVPWVGGGSIRWPEQP